MEDKEFFCPQCYKKAEPTRRDWIKYSFARLELPTFLCGDCRTAYIDWPTIRRKIRCWRNESGYLTEIPYRELVREITEWFRQGFEEYYIKYLGYREVKFLKRRRAKT